MDNFFIQALVRAGTCQEHLVNNKPQRRYSSFTTSYHKTRRRSTSYVDAARNLRTKQMGNTAMFTTEEEMEQESKKELMSLVATYRMTEADDDEKDLYRVLPSPSDPHPHKEHTLDTEILTNSEWDPLEPVHETIYPTENDSGTSNAEVVPAAKTIDFVDNTMKDQQQDGNVLFAVWQLRRLLKDELSSNEELFQSYKKLPTPRASFLCQRELRLLLNRLAWNKTLNESVMLRFLSILDDMKAANIEIDQHDWNTAIYFAGKCAGRISQTEVESTLLLWKEMEQEAGVQGDIVTFTILFDAASKAGKFVLASMILKEMEYRKLQFDRTTRMTRMYYYGLRRDGDGVRREYLTLVKAGEIVDTAVLTCVMKSLINAGEPTGAEQIFERMKVLHASRTGATLPPTSWRGDRKMRRILTRAANKWRDNPNARANIQEAAPLAPNVTTYGVLIEYHCFETGNVDRTFELLEEMEISGLHLDGSIFYWLFTGFARHGGTEYSSWTLSRLERIMSMFLTACEERPSDVEPGHGTTHMAVKAFIVCANFERAIEIWNELKVRWTPGEKTINAVNRALLSKRDGDEFSPSRLWYGSYRN
jgi:pentatricopeptide repeat protein